MFLLHAVEQPMRWSEVISRLPELISDNEHFEFFWFPHSECCLTKRNNRSAGPAQPLTRWRYWLDDEFISNSVFAATCRLGHAGTSDDQGAELDRRRAAQRADLHRRGVPSVHQPAAGAV